MWSLRCIFTFVFLNHFLYYVLSFTEEPVLLAHNNNILQLGPNTSSVVVSADTPVVAFDIHNYWRQIFWATDFFIYRTPLYDLHATTVVAVTGRVCRGGLALDWIHQELYWCDCTRNRVEAVHLDGRFRRVVYEAKGVMGALTLDPRVGKLFWVELNYTKGTQHTSIVSSDTDGSQVEVLWSRDYIDHNNALAIDLEYECLYFYKEVETRYGVNEQWELSYGGRRRPGAVKQFERQEGPATSLAITQKGFYYSSDNGLILGMWEKKSYSVISGNISAQVVVLDPHFVKVDEELRNISQIRVDSKAAQPRSQDIRGEYRCQHRSIGPQSYACLCRFGFSLKDDLSSCSEEGYVFYSTSNTFGRAKLDGKQETTLLNDSTLNIEAFDIHVSSGYLFWADLSSQTIYRSLIDNPVRRTALVQNVSAYGLAVDWIHNNVYWTEDTKIMIVSTKGENKMHVLDELDSPSEISVDPINRYLFWTECGSSSSLKRAALVGDYVIPLKNNVTCGTTVTSDPKSQTLYWLDGVGRIYTCDYNGKHYKELFVDLASAIVIHYGRLLLFPIEQKKSFVPEGDTYVFNNIHIQPKAVKIVKSTQQPAALNSCSITDCAGLCLPFSNVTLPLCICPEENRPPKPCSIRKKTNKTPGLLELVSATPFSVTLKCSGALLDHRIMQPSIQISEVASLVNRSNHVRPPWTVRVDHKHRPFTIDMVNPATTYNLVLRNRVTRAAFSMTVHTPPPPLRVDRLPLVTLPWSTPPPPAWLPQTIHYFDPNPWDDLILREYLLLLISKEEHHQTVSFPIEATTAKLIGEEIKDNYVILKHYHTKEEFDDDPVMHLGNTPWGKEFWLAMVQVLRYEGAQHLDFVYSQNFSLPDPSWINFMNYILEDYKEYEIN